MKPLAIVKALPHELEDVGDGFRRFARIRLEREGSFCRFDDDHGTGVLRVREHGPAREGRRHQNERQNPPPADHERAVLTTPSRGHHLLITQAPHLGYTGRQTFWPHVTRYRLMIGHQRGGVDLYRACSVSSGVVVFTHPSRFEIRCTCVSTQIFFTLLNARISTRLAVFLPTPGNVSRFSIVSGTRPLNLSTRIRQVSFTCFAL